MVWINYHNYTNMRCKLCYRMALVCHTDHGQYNICTFSPAEGSYEETMDEGARGV